MISALSGDNVELPWERGILISICDTRRIINRLRGFWRRAMTISGRHLRMGPLPYRHTNEPEQITSRQLFTCKAAKAIARACAPTERCRHDMTERRGPRLRDIFSEVTQLMWSSQKERCIWLKVSNFFSAPAYLYKTGIFSLWILNILFDKIRNAPDPER